MILSELQERIDKLKMTNARREIAGTVRLIQQKHSRLCILLENQINTSEGFDRVQYLVDVRSNVVLDPDIADHGGIESAFANCAWQL